MAFTRQIDDPCEVQTRANESTGLLSHIMDFNRYHNCNPCYLDRIPGGNTTSLYTGNLVNLESELSGRVRAHSKCPAGKYLPGTVIQGERQRKGVDRGGLPSEPGSEGLVHLPRCSPLAKYPKKPTHPGFVLKEPCSKTSLLPRSSKASVRKNLYVPNEYLAGARY